MIGELAEYERLSDQVSADESLLEQHLFGRRPLAEALVGELGGRVSGYALYFFSYSTFLTKPGIYLEDLFVRPKARGRGLGRALLAAVAARAVELGCARLEWAVLNWNQPAIEFYRSIGAQPLEEWTTYRLTGRALAELARRATVRAGH
ncbi:MAG: GNAT family N-acetyltransferase [Candidatus Dadabacteria bacterium]|nr:MAG: GNAT family N-acetyltransferase [Candidatus Dadabacteria bacterium]